MGYEKNVVMIIEDDPTYRKLLRRIIEDRIGAKCVDASNPCEAFPLFRDSIPDLIIMDLLMPEMHGATAIEKLRSFASTQNIPIAVCTAVTDKELIVHLAKLGIKEYFVKPLNSVLVVDKIKELLPKPVEEKQEVPAPAEQKPEEEIWV